MLNKLKKLYKKLFSCKHKKFTKRKVRNLEVDRHTCTKCPKSYLVHR